MGLALLLQSLYAIVDLAWVGDLGAEAVAGLSISLQAFFIILALGQIIGATAVADISQAYGRNELGVANGLMSTFTIVALGLGVVSGLVAFATAPAYVAAFTDSPVVFELGLEYFRINAITFVFQLMLIIFSNGVRASGDFVTPMRFMMVSVLINLVLDPLLIYGIGPFPELGLGGAAWATVIAQAVACGLYARRLSRRNADPRALRWGPPTWRDGVWRRLLFRGVPAGVQFFLLSAVLAVVLTAMKPHGAAWTATAGGGFRVLQQAFLPMIALSSAAAALAGQNLGARRYDRVQLSAMTALRWASFYAFGAGVFLFFGGELAAHLFARGPDELAVGAEYFKWTAPSLVAFAFTYIPAFVLQAAGRAVLPMAAAILRVVLLAVLVAVVIPTMGLPPEFVFGAITITAFAEGGAGTVLLVRFLRGLRAGEDPPGGAPVAPEPA